MMPGFHRRGKGRVHPELKGAAEKREQEPRLRGEPRQCGDRAHRLVAPSLAPTGERRPSMACLRPIPALSRLSPAECPWLRRFRLGEVEGNARRSGEHHAAKDVAARGFRPSGTWMYRARVLEQDAEPRGGRNPLAAAAPARSEAFALAAAAPARSRGCCPCSGGPRPKPRLLPLQRRPHPEPGLPLWLSRAGFGAARRPAATPVRSGCWGGVPHRWR